MNPRKTNPLDRRPGRPSDPRLPASDASAHLDYRLTAYLSGAISEAGRREVERHLAACEECRRELASLEDAFAAARAAVAPEPGAGDPALAPERFEAILAAARRGGWHDLGSWAIRHWRPLGLAAAALVAAGLLLPAILVETPMARSRREVESPYLALEPGQLREPGGPGEKAPGSDEYSARILARREEAPRGELDRAERRGVALRRAAGARPGSPEPGAAGGAAEVPPLAAPAPGAPAERAPPPALPPATASAPEAGPATTLGARVEEGRPAAAGEIDAGYGQLRAPGAPERDGLGSRARRELSVDATRPAPEEPRDGLRAQDAGSLRSNGRSAKSGAARVSRTATMPSETMQSGKMAGAIESREEFKAEAGGATEELRERDARFLSESDFADFVGEEETSASAAEVEEEDELGLRMEGDTDFGGDGLLWENLAEASEYALGAPGRTLGYAEKLLPPQSRLADKGGAVGDGAKFSAGLAPRLGDLERRLRAFAHYRALDPSLSFETFAARDLRVPPPAIGDEGLGADGFRRRYGVHPFVETRLDRFSTFGMDVDTASWSLALAHFRAGKLPPPKAVRVEEFVNSFGEDIPVDPEEVFAFAAEGGPSPFGEGLDLLKIAVKARELREGERKDAVLTFLIDASGSMAAALSSGIEKEPSGRASRKAVEGASRLEAVQGALAALLESLSSEDRVQIVAYATTPYLVLPLTPAREGPRIVGALKSLQPSGATNLEAGLDLAYRVADEAFNPRAVNRVILASDGAANLGARDPEEILKRVEVFARRGIYLSALGFGLGKYDDAMLETLADRGNGNYAHVDTPERAREILRANLPRTLQVLAADAKIQVEFDPEVVTHYRLLGYENRDIRDEDFRNDKVDAGEVGPGSTVTVLYEIRRKAAATGNLGRIFLRYRDAGTGRVEERDYPLSPGVLATRFEETTDRFRFVASVAELAELLRGSYWARDGSYAKVLEVLGGLSPEFRATPAWREVAEAALRAQALTVRELAGR